MIITPRELLGSASVPGGDELRLFRRGGDFMIVLDRNELMSSRMSGSEEALALMTCERLTGVAAPHLLIGGYGMGFTLRAAQSLARPTFRHRIQLRPESELEGVSVDGVLENVLASVPVPR